MSATRDEVIAAFKSCLDPELDVDIWTLGFIYGFDVNAKENSIAVRMTLSSPLCPFGPQLMEDVRAKLKALGFSTISIDLVFDPPWTPPEGLREMLGA